MTAREIRKAWLMSRGMTERDFNQSIRLMVEREAKRDRKKSLKKRRHRRLLKAWRRRNG